MDFIKTVSNYIRKEKLFSPGSLVLVAVSGGVDSMVLADVLYRLREALRIRMSVASFDHRLRPDSGSDVEFVRDWAEGHGLPFWGGSKDIAVLAQGKNVEDAARRERYAFLRAAAAKCGASAIATAHHRDDQAETLLLHLLRGSGVTGLGGMHPDRDGIVRPLLCVCRSDILNYAASHNIQYREDSTNTSVQYLRNRIRLELLPVLAEYNPAISAQLNATAAICRDEDALLDDLTEISLAELWSTEQSSLSGAGFDLLAPALQRRVLRKAFLLLAGDLPELSYRQVEAIRDLKEEQCCDLPRGLKAWRRRDICFGAVMPPLPCVRQEWTLSPDGAWHDLEGLDWSYRATLHEDADLPEVSETDKYTALFTEGQLEGAVWRTRRDGDYMQSSGSRGRVKIKDLFIEQHIPAFLRASWPLLVSGEGETLWLPGLRKPKTRRHPNNILIIVRFSDKIKFNPKTR